MTVLSTEMSPPSGYYLCRIEYLKYITEIEKDGTLVLKNLHLSGECLLSW